MPVNEARHQLGGISLTTFYGLVKEGELSRTLMLVALGDKPARRTRTATTPSGAQTPAVQRLALTPQRSAKSHVNPLHPPIAGHRRHPTREHKILHRYNPIRHRQCSQHTPRRHRWMQTLRQI
jgi:hypothetical protein